MTATAQTRTPSRLPVRLAWAGHALPWLLAVAFYFVGGGYLSLGANTLIMILFALSLDLVLGFAGIVTLGQAAFYGLGAYVAGIVAIHVNGDPLLGLAAAAAVAGLFGLVTGAMILHTRGITLMMLTLAVGALLAQFANQARGLTGGDDGLSNIAMSPVLGRFRFDLWGHTAYLYALAVLFVWFVATWRVMRSPFGRSLDGIRQNPHRMRAIGTPVWLRLVAVYGLGAAMAGSAGALTAQTTELVGLNTLSLLSSGTVLVVIILGGMRRLYGAFAGAVVYVVAQDLTAEADPFRWMFLIGIMLMAAVLFLENGLIGVIDRANGVLAALLQRREER